MIDEIIENIGKISVELDKLYDDYSNYVSSDFNTISSLIRNLILSSELGDEYIDLNWKGNIFETISESKVRDFWTKIKSTYLLNKNQIKTDLSSIKGIKKLDNKAYNVASGVFNNQNNLEYIDLTNSPNITRLDQNSFQNCSSLTSLHSNDITSVGPNTFDYDYWLQDVQLCSLRNINSRYFGGDCSDKEKIPVTYKAGFLSSLIIDNKYLKSSDDGYGNENYIVTSQDGKALKWVSPFCTRLSNDEILTADACAMYNNSKLTSISFANCTTLCSNTMNDSCLWSSGVKTAYLPNVTVWGNCLFGWSNVAHVYVNNSKYHSIDYKGQENALVVSDDEKSLKLYCYSGSNDVYEDANLTVIENGAFYTKTNLGKALFPNVLSVMEYAFHAANTMTSCWIPKCEYVGQRAFQMNIGAGRMSSLYIPNVLSIGDYAFQYNNYLEKVIIADSNPKYTTSDDGSILYNKSKTYVLWGSIPKSVNVDLPSTVKTIAGQAFSYAQNLKTLNMPNVTTIYGYAFDHAHNIVSINMPVVTYMGSYAFSMYGQGDPEIEELWLPKIVSIGSNALNGIKSLKKIDFTGRDSVTASHYNSGSNVPSLGNSETIRAYTSVEGTITEQHPVSCYVPKESYQEWISQTNWAAAKESGYIDIISVDI